MALQFPPKRLLVFGLLVIMVTAAIDISQKMFIIDGLGWTGGEKVVVSSFFDFVLVWNPGVSYGAFSWLGPQILTLIMIAAMGFLIFWMLKSDRKIIIFALGLIVGGAVGNLVDRLRFGAVADFYSFHIGHFYWYIFNLADVWIVVGVAILLYDTVFGDRNIATNEE